MYKTGLAIITKGLTETNLQIVYQFAKKYVGGRLYVSVKGFSPFNGDWKSHITTCYTTANKVCPELDIRLLMPSCEDSLKERDISVILCDNVDMKYENLLPFMNYASATLPQLLFNVKGCGEVILESPQKYLLAPFSSVCLGGTFDRLHNGHKILLSLAAILTDKNLFCGVSSDAMIKEKCLAELIQPLKTRLEAVTTFLEDVRLGPRYSVVPIETAVGPTTERPDFDCIVASVETEKGCKAVNEARVSRGLSRLEVHLVDLVEEGEALEGSGEFWPLLGDSKASSSGTRLRLLGTLLHPPRVRARQGRPYVVGLTGGIASGKSSIAARLASMGAHVINCDRLGHLAYKSGTECFSRVVAAFGPQIVSDTDGEIDRRQLGAAVFSDRSRMTILTDIVWPEVARLAQAEIDRLPSTVVAIIDAAVLLDANWDALCDEVWVTFVPRGEAVARIRDRNRLGEAEAAARIDSQRSNHSYVAAANLVLCSLWSREFTAWQVGRAWAGVVARATSSSSSSDHG